MLTAEPLVGEVLLWPSALIHVLADPVAVLQFDQKAKLLQRFFVTTVMSTNLRDNMALCFCLVFILEDE